MILVLTYHRIRENGGAIDGFFDVTAGELDSHLAAAKRTWGGCVPLQSLHQNNFAAGKRAGIVVTFDDGTADHYFRAAPVLERHGLGGVFFVNTATLGTGGYLTWAQCQELVARGHAVESHSHDHVLLNSLAGDELHRQLTESRRRLREAGLGQNDLLAPPGGYRNASVTEAAKNCGYFALRTLEWGYNRRLAPLRLQSITINRKTAGNWFEPLISPRFETAKQLFYGAKETLKQRLPGFYKSLQSSRQ
jgi:peptidoglycan/xylan/chitin deacetylase (PgdA/CDA1 family)